MNRTYLAGQQFRAPDGGDGTGGTAAPAAVEPAAARTFLTEFGHNADALKTMPDPDVVKLHSTVAASIGKHAPKPKEETGEVTLKLPEKTLLQAADVDRIKAYAKENKISQKEAERILNVEHDASTRFVQQQVDIHSKNLKDWHDTVTNDPEMGGANLVETQRLAALSIDRFVKPNAALATLMRDSGYGQHPAVVKLWRDIGKAMAEDAGLRGKGPGAGDKKDAATVLYGETKQP